jgi:Na+-transporting NADH:ubiquinone oxidoreductase subunit F
METEGIKVTVNEQRELLVEDGWPLLAALRAQGIFVPSACGGRAACGLCKLRITEGAGEPQPAEIAWLSPRERSAGVRLACQTEVHHPLRVAIREELLRVREFRTEVVSIRDLTPDIRELRLELRNTDEIAFTPGQFVQIVVPSYSPGVEPVYRPYSIASPDDDRKHVELEIRYVPNGICTTYVHRHLKVGDKITINGPYGDFGLRPTGREIIFIAGGSGMAPIKSILASMARERNPRRATYFFGAKTGRDLFLVDELRAAEKNLPAFRFIPALSAPAPDDAWTGERGLITEVVDRHCERCENMEAYLCGSPLMIDACIAVLKRKGMPESQIFYDKF